MNVLGVCIINWYYAQQKLVSCISGKILDVIVDVRPFINYNKPISYVLDEEKPEVIMIGKGYAHGFLTLSKNSIMSYLTSTIYAPKLIAEYYGRIALNGH